MSDEQVVKQKWPDAKLVGWIDGACAIFSDKAALSGETGYIGWGQMKFNVSSTEANKQAWADAAAKLREEPTMSKCQHGVDVARVQCHDCARDGYAKLREEPTMTIEELIQKLDEAEEKTNEDPDEFSGGESEYQYLSGASEAYSKAAHWARRLREEPGKLWDTCTDCELPLPSCKCNVDATAVNEAATPSLSPEMATFMERIRSLCEAARPHQKKISLEFSVAELKELLDALEGKS